MNSKATSVQGASSSDIPNRHGSQSRPLTIEERRKLVGESLRVGNPPNHAKELPDVADPKFDCQLELAVDAIKPYERNPRRADNVKFSEIKESIRVGGIRNPLTVTRRPGDTNFIVEAGGNTRLVAIQQLWAETGDPRFQKITVMYRPWRSESHVLTAHLIENEQRGELTFWDKAVSAMALKAELEAEQSRTLSMREFEEELKQRGMSANRSGLSQYQFATEKLNALGAALASVSGADVKAIQPRLNLIKRYAEKRAGTTEAELYAQFLNRVLERHADRYSKTRVFNATALCEDCELALSEHFSVPITQLRLVLDQLEKSPDLPREALEATVASGVETAHAAPTATPVTGGAATAPRVITADTRTSPVQPVERVSARQSAVAPVRTNSLADLSHPARGQSPDDSTLLALLEDVKQCAAHFARLTGVGDCLNFCELMPCGYYMEAPPTPLDLEPDQPLRHRAWWVLALMSGQMHEEVSRHLPAQSRWAQAHVQDELSDSELPLLIENELGGFLTLDAVLTDWLLDSTDDAASLFWEIVVLVREIRKLAPTRVAIPDTSNAFARKS